MVECDPVSHVASSGHLLRSYSWCVLRWGEVGLASDYAVAAFATFHTGDKESAAINFEDVVVSTECPRDDVGESRKHFVSPSGLLLPPRGNLQIGSRT
jgi:hypothetical protein